MQVFWKLDPLILMRSLFVQLYKEDRKYNYVKSLIRKNFFTLSQLYQVLSMYLPTYVTLLSLSLLVSRKSEQSSVVIFRSDYKYISTYLLNYFWTDIVIYQCERLPTRQITRIVVIISDSFSCRGKVLLVLWQRHG